MGDVIYGVDFKAKRNQDIEKMAAEIIALALLPTSIGMEFGCDIYESTLGWIAPEKDPA